MSLTPIELRHVKLATRPFGYERAACDRLIERVRESIDELWRERDALRAQVSELEATLLKEREEWQQARAELERARLERAAVEVNAHREPSGDDGLLREALIAAQRAAAELRDELHSRVRAEVEREDRPESRDGSADVLSRREELETEVRRLEAMRAELLRDYRVLLAKAVELVEPEQVTPGSSLGAAPGDSSPEPG